MNDPAEQERRFRQQVERGGEEVPREVDMDYVRALAHGMPPAAGEGIGIDRLTMLFTDAHSIREVILFPLLRPEGSRQEASAAASDHPGPINIGTPHEVSMLQLAQAIKDLCGSSAEISFIPRPEDDPTVRQPDISLAREVLGWEPVVPFEEGLKRTIAWFREQPLD